MGLRLRAREELRYKKYKKKSSNLIEPDVRQIPTLISKFVNKHLIVFNKHPSCEIDSRENEM